jgi:superfamily I DNA/RNA helicase
MNSLVSEHLGLSGMIQKGDEIVINGVDAVFDSYIDFDDPNADWLFPSCISKGRIKPELADKALADISKFNVDLGGYGVARVVIDDKKYRVYYAIDHYAQSKKLKQDVEEVQKQVYLNNNIPDDIALAQWCKANYNAPYVRDRGIAWSNFLKHQNYVFDMRHPYVRTVHKSQGAEFRTVYINQRDLKIAIRPGYYEQYARLMYVALSRAIDKVVIVEV